MFTIKKVDGFSRGSRLVNNYRDDVVPSQRNKKNEALSRGYFVFLCSRIVTAR